MSKCLNCKEPAQYKVTWDDGSAYAFTCLEHIPVGSNVENIVF